MTQYTNNLIYKEEYFRLKQFFPIMQKGNFSDYRRISILNVDLKTLCDVDKHFIFNYTKAKLS